MSQGLPRIYRMGRSGRLFYLSLASLAIAMGIAGLVYFVGFHHEDTASWIVASVCIAFALLGAPLIGAALFTRVVLYPDAIEYRGMFRRRRLGRSDVEGWSFTPQKYGPPTIRLKSHTPGVGSLTLPQFLDIDEEFHRWFDGLVSFEAREQQKSMAAVLSDPDLPGSKDEKIMKLEQARRLAQVAYYATLALCLWSFIHPSPYGLVIAGVVLLPWAGIAIAWRGGGLYRFNPRRGDVRADLSAPVMIPGLFLLIRALLDVQILDLWKCLALGIVVALAWIGVVVLIVDQVRASKSGALMLGAWMIIYGYGVTALADALFDRGKPQSFATRVLDMRISGGRTTSYYLDLAPWGSRREHEEVDVGRDFFHRAKKGDTVCVYVFPGALGVRWFEVQGC